MSLPPFATLEDLSQRRPGGTGDFARAAAALDDVSDLIRAETGSDWADTTPPGVFKVICCSVARRILDDEASVVSRSQSLGSYAESQTFAQVTSDIFTSAELRALRRAAGHGGVYALATTRDPDNRGLETANVIVGDGTTVLLPTDPAGDWMPWTVDVG